MCAWVVWCCAELAVWQRIESGADVNGEADSSVGEYGHSSASPYAHDNYPFGEDVR